MDKSKNKYANPSESSNGHIQSSNENDEKSQHESDQTDDENSNKSLSHSNQKHKSDQFADLSDCNDNNEQSQSSSAKNKEQQNKNEYIDNYIDNDIDDKDDLSSFQKVKHKKSKRYELRVSHSDKKDDDLSESDDNNERRKSSNKSDEEYHLTSDDTNESFSGKDDKNLAKREKHKFCKRYELRASHSNKIDKSNKNVDPTKSGNEHKHKQSSNENIEEEKLESEDSDDNNKSSNGKDEIEKRKKTKRYELRKLYLDKKYKSNKCADLPECYDDIGLNILPNKGNEEYQHESEYDCFNIRDNENTNKNKKLKKNMRVELRKLHFQNKYHTDTSENDDDYTWSQSSNESDNNDDIDDKIESSNNRDNGKSDIELVTPYTGYFKRRTRHIGLDERINMLKAYYHFHFSYHKLSSMFNCTMQQIGETLAYRRDIIKEYKKQHPDFDENDLKTPKNHACNTLNLDERIDVLRAYNRNHYEHRKLACMFNCSKRQIEFTLANRMSLIKEYKKQHPDFDDIELITPENRAYNNTLSWDKRIDIIKAYHHQGYTPYKLACMYNCSPGQVHNILINREDIIKEYKKQHPDFVEAELEAPTDEHIYNNLSLDQRIDILRCHDSYHYHYYKLASMFNCSVGQIENTLVNRKTLVEEYKKQHPDFVETKLKTPRNRVRNRLSLNKRIDVIKAYDGRLHTPDKLAFLFKCSVQQIKSILINHKDIIKEYKKQHPDFVENELNAQKNRICNTFHLDEHCSEFKEEDDERICNNLSLDKRIDILRAHDSNHYSYCKLSSMFSCSMGQIENTLINREALIKDYKIQYPDFDENDLKTQKNPVCTSLSLDERIDVIKAYNRNHCSYYKLASIFNCSMEHIENILANRKTLIEDYKTQHPDYDESDLQVSHYADNVIMKPKNVNKLTMEKCKEVIIAYDQDSDYIKLSRLFNFSIAQIKSIIQNRDGIIKNYETSINNISNNDYQDDIQIGSTCLNSVNKLSLNAETISQNVSQTQHTGNSNTNNGDKDNYKKLNDLTAEDTVVSIVIEDKEFPTHHEKTYDVIDQVNDSYKLYDINRESTNSNNNSSAKISNEMGQLCFLKFNMNSKLSNNNQNDDHDHDDDDDNDDCDSVELTNDRTLRWNKLYLRKYVQVIKAYDEKNSYSALASRFNCSWLLIHNIIKNRLMILKALGSRIQIKLTLVERLDVHRDYMCKNYSYQQLSQIYHCSLAEIEKCIRDHSSYNKIINRLYPLEKIDGIIKSKHIQSLIIRAFDHYPNEMLLSRLYNYSLSNIFKIIENRGKILKQYQNSQTNIFENLTISRHRDILLALKPLVAYAKLINNSDAITIMSELEEHLNCFNKNIPKSNYSLQKNVEIISYNDALNALKPIENFTELTKNNNAKNVIIRLGMHLIKNLEKNS